MNTNRCTAVVLAVVLLGAVFAPLGAASPTTLESQSTEPADAADATAQIDESLFDESGETDLFLYLPDIDASTRQAGPDAVESALKSTAERTQGPVLDALDEYDAVSVRDTFWIRNSVLVTADLDEIDLETLAAIDGVERILPAPTLEVPEPDGATPAEAGTGEPTWGLDAINAPEVWEDFDVTGEGIRVAVADTGVVADHPDIELAEEDGWYDATGDSSEPVDTFGHGTHVTGTISGGDASGTAIGVAPDVEIGAVRVCPGQSCDSQAIMESFEWAVETDSDILNFSLGGTPYGSYIEPVYNTMDAGTLVVAGAGNSGEGTVISPAAPWDSVAAGAIHENHSVAGFSSGKLITPEDFQLGEWMSHWPEDEEYIAPDVTTPGVNIYSAHSGGSMADCGDAEYCRVSGTSMATPHSSGIAALVMSADPDLGPYEVKDVLMEAAWKPEDWDPGEAQHYNPDTGRDSRYGVGIVDAYEAVSQVAEPPGEAEFAVSIDGTNAPVTEGEDLVVDATVENVGDGSGDDTIELADFDGAVVDSQSVSLDAGESTSIELTWNTDVGDAGSGEVTVSSGDQSDTATVEIQSDEPPEEGVIRLGSASVAAGEEVTVDLDTDFDDIAGYQAQISYDASAFDFVEASGVDINDPTVNDENGTLTLSASQAQGVDAPTLAELTFEAVGSAGDSTDLAFAESETQLNTEDAIVQPTEYADGSLTIEADEPPEEGFIRLGEAEASAGQTATVSLDSDLDGIAGYQARIDYDPSVVSFVEAAGVDLPDPTVNAENGTLTLSASAAQGTDAPTLANLTFEAVGSAGDATDLTFDTEFTRLNTEDEIVEPAEYLDGSFAVGESDCALAGDVDGDGQVTSIDATKTQQHIVGMDPGTFNEACADLNGDGEITPADVTQIQQIIVGMTG
ncbi:S8 family serine peptidase [Halovivax limisalsi]|uniref:S8 family serine peptidase n=1 Tax=Halovivax limisalsi TaxID=1453760 RepID=UPI001FFC7EA3|nr:S8 family serine peptidase [Halovivax limisalsi]